MVPKPALKGLTGKSPAIGEVNRLIHKASRSDCPVIICGETGVGKSMAAECIHCLSLRKSKRFLQQGCSNIPKELFESDLFGHEKGVNGNLNSYGYGKQNSHGHGKQNIMVYQIQTKKGRNLRCISLQYNKEDTFEKKKDI